MPSSNEFPRLFSGIQSSDSERLAWLENGIDQHAIIALTDADGVILEVNERFCEISGYSRAELIGQTHRLIRSGAHPPEFFKTLWSTIKAGRTWRGIICNRAKSGSLYWVKSTIVPLLGPDGRPQYYLALRTDVTRLKTAEQFNARLTSEITTQTEALRSAQGQITLFFEHAPIGIAWSEIGPDGLQGVNHVNRRFCELAGLTMEEARDMANVKKATHPADWVVQDKLTHELYAGHRDRFSMEKRYLHRDGRVVWGFLTVVVLRDSTGRVTHHFGMLEDITEQRAAQDELKRSESRWRTYLAIASEILYALTPELTFKFVSPAWTAKLGHPIDEILERQIFDFIHPDDAQSCRQFITSILEGMPDAGSVEYRIRHRDGRWIWHASSGSAYYDRDGRRAYFGVGRDISLRRQAQDELRLALARREELERIINRSPSVVVLWRAEEENWPVEFVSASVRQFGYTPEQFTTRQLSFIDITHPDDRDRVAAELTAHATAGHAEYNQEYRIVCADGSSRWVDDHTVVRRDTAGQVTHHEGLIADITARKAAEERERDLRERDLQLAGEIQHHLRPHVFPDIGEVEIETMSMPTLHIGGDYHDVLPVDGRRWGFVVADVAGKGAGAALMMAACRATLRLCAAGEMSPAAVVRRVNRALHPDMPRGMFIALFYGILDLDTNILRYARAGHEPALLLRAGAKSPELLQGEGLALGLDGGELFDTLLRDEEVALVPGDLLALYTDGITEATNVQGAEFGRERLGICLLRNEDKPLIEVVRTLDRYLRQFTAAAPRHDDRTLLLVRPR